MDDEEKRIKRGWCILCGHLNTTDPRMKKFLPYPDMFTKNTGQHKLMTLIADGYDMSGPMLDELNLRQFYESILDACNRVTYYEFVEAYKDMAKEVDFEVETDESIFTATEFYDDYSRLYEDGEKRGYPTGWKEVNAIYTVAKGEVTVVCGHPGMGKSEWMDAVLVNLAKFQGFKFAVFSPENLPTELHLRKLAEKYMEKPFHGNNRMTHEEAHYALEWIHKHFIFINPMESDVTLAFLLDRFNRIHKEHGIDGVLIDPWNEIDHSRPDGVNAVDYIAKSLMQIRRLAQENMLCCWIVHHPTKGLTSIKGELRCPKGQDLDGAAHWANKPSNVIAVHRDMADDPYKVGVYVHKARNRMVAHIGTAYLQYDITTGTYTGYGSPI